MAENQALRHNYHCLDPLTQLEWPEMSQVRASGGAPRDSWTGFHTVIHPSHPGCTARRLTGLPVPLPMTPL